MKEAKERLKARERMVEAYEGEMKGAQTDQERWQITMRHKGVFTISLWEDNGLEDDMKARIMRPGRLTDMILREFPKIAARLTWRTSNLEALGRKLESEARPTYEISYGEGLDEVLVMHVSVLSEGEVAGILLCELVGKDFRTAEGFRAWYEVRAERLRWNSTTGRFEDNQGGKGGVTNAL